MGVVWFGLGMSSCKGHVGPGIMGAISTRSDTGVGDLEGRIGTS